MALNTDDITPQQKIRSPDYTQCPECGKENPENLAKCTKCGETLQ